GGLGVTNSGHIEYLLGGKNHLIFTTIPFMSIVYIYSYKKYEKLTITNLSLIFTSLISIILAGSGTGIILSLVYIVFIVFPKTLYPSIYSYIAINIALFVMIIIYRVHEKWFSFIIVDVLEKSTTFSGRTLLWDISLDAIKSKPLIGHGRGNTIISDVYWYLKESHNGF